MSAKITPVWGSLKPGPLIRIAYRIHCEDCKLLGRKTSYRSAERDRENHNKKHHA